MLVASLTGASTGTVTYSWICGKVHLLCPSLSMRRHAICTPVSSGSVSFSLPSPSPVVRNNEPLPPALAPPLHSLFLGSLPPYLNHGLKSHLRMLSYLRKQLKSMTNSAYGRKGLLWLTVQGQSLRPRSILEGKLRKLGQLVTLQPLSRSRVWKCWN